MDSVTEQQLLEVLERLLKSMLSGNETVKPGIHVSDTEMIEDEDTLRVILDNGQMFSILVAQEYCGDTARD